MSDHYYPPYPCCGGLTFHAGGPKCDDYVRGRSKPCTHINHRPPWAYCPDCGREMVQYDVLAGGIAALRKHEPPVVLVSETAMGALKIAASMAYGNRDAAQTLTDRLAEALYYRRDCGRGDEAYARALLREYVTSIGKQPEWDCYGEFKLTTEEK